MEADEIDRLFNETVQSKKDLGVKLAKLRSMMIEARKTYAVDAPDGYPDAYSKEELLEVEHIIEDAALHEDKDMVRRLHKEQEEASKIYAVDSPDGTADANIEEELEEIKHIVDDAAAWEDKDSVVRMHKAEDKIRKDRARDPEHDW